MADSGQNPARALCGYSLERKIRTGPHLAVFETRDNLGRRLEVSCYRGDRLLDRTSTETFLTEARQTASLHHENLCPLIDAGEEEGVWFAVSVAPDGPSLRDLLDRGGAIAEERVRVVALGAIAALGYLADQGLRHGDIRPETLFLSGGRLLVAPRRLVPLALKERDARYIAPEEIRVEGTDVRSDLFSLGAVLHEALTGAPAFPADSPEEALRAITGGPPPMSADVSEELQRLVGALLAESPDNRPTDPMTVSRALSGEISLAPPAMAEAAPDLAGATAPATSPAAFTAPSPPPPSAPMPPSRRESGALTATGLAGAEDCQWDLLQEPVWISRKEDGTVVFTAEEVKNALARVEPGDEGDTLVIAEGADPRPRLNGSLVDHHALAFGDLITIADREIRYGAMRSPARRSGQDVASRSRSGPVWIPLVTVGLCVLVIAIQAFRGMSEDRRGEDVLTAATEAEARLSGRPAGGDAGKTTDELNRRAETAFAAARSFARENPDSFDRIAENYRRIRQLYGVTRFDFPALREIEKNERRRQELLTRTFNGLVERTGQFFEAGRLYDAYLLYQNFADDHSGTRFADRAAREAEQLLEVIEVRFEEDLARADEAASERDFGVALDILSAAEVYGSPKVKRRATHRMNQIRAVIQETQVPGEEGPDTPIPPDPEQPDPVPEPGGTEQPEPTDPEAEAAAKLEGKAESIFEEGRKELLRQRWDRAIPHFERLYLEPHRSTRFFAENEGEIDRLLGLSRLENLGYAGLFGGQVKIKRGRQVILTYEFDTAEEEEDWIYLKPFADPGLGSFDHIEGTMVGRGVGAYVHEAVFEPGSVVMKARVQAVKPNDFGLMFFEPETMTRFFLFHVQNRYFTIGARREKIYENVIWNIGGGAWADTPDGEIGFVFKARSKNPTVTAGEWIDLVAEKKADTVSFSIKRSKPLKGSALGDDGYRAPAYRPALFVLKSEAVFDRVVIEGTLEEGWAKGAFNRAREKFRR